MRPIDVATNETFEFVNGHISAAHLRILEVGCGNGELARKLQNNGHQLTAIDSSREAVENARSMGVNAILAHWPDFEAEPFDLILFTRALHHMHPLSPAVIRARQLLKPSGLLLIEDFAFSDVHAQAAAWFYWLLSLLDACGALHLQEGTFGTKILKGRGGLELWQERVHEINSADAVLEAVRKKFDILQTYSVPYLYRYVSEMVENNDTGAEIISTVLNLEATTGEEDQGFLIGRRLVAR